MTTNGLNIRWKIPELKTWGLTHLNISIDSLVEAKFDFITWWLNGLPAVLESIEQAEKASFKALKLNCVLMWGFNDDEITNFIDFVKDRNIEMWFIEFMPFDENKWSAKKMI